MKLKYVVTAAAVFGVATLVTQAARERVKVAEPPKAQVQAESPVLAGKYLVMIGGCNDCHTPGYGEKMGKVAEGDWLTGSPVGFKGPWGTTYPSNLRLTVSLVDEAGWVQMMHTRNARPPMPWLSMNAMSDADLKGIYQYIKSLGMKGEKAPDYVPPGAETKGPVVVFPAPPEE